MEYDLPAAEKLRRMHAQRAQFEHNVPLTRFSTMNTQDFPPSVQAYLDAPVPDFEIDDEFKILNDVIFTTRNVRYEFNDDCYLNKIAFSTPRVSPTVICQYGRLIIPCISSSFSPNTAAGLFFLAYHLKPPRSVYGGRYVYDGMDGISTNGDIDFNNLSSRPFNQMGTHVPHPPTYDLELEAAAYSFIAASLFRVFTKSPSNYVNAWTHIKEGFSRFYGKPFPLDLRTPLETCIKSLSNWFTMETKAKHTLFRILYLGNADNIHAGGIQKILFELQISHTGMHIVSLFANLCRILNVNTSVVLNLLDIPEFHRQVIGLRKMIQFITAGRPENARKMWRYGRLFDEDFMPDLQTKACPKLVLILGEALKSEQPNEFRGIEKIAQLAALDDRSKTNCRDIGLKMVQLIRQKNTKDASEQQRIL